MQTVERVNFKLSEGVKYTHLQAIRHHNKLIDTTDLGKTIRQAAGRAVGIREFIRIATTKPLYVSYEASNWLEHGVIKYRIDRISFYDNAEEYNKAVFRDKLIMGDN